MFLIFPISHKITIIKNNIKILQSYSFKKPVLIIMAQINLLECFFEQGNFLRHPVVCFENEISFKVVVYHYRPIFDKNKIQVKNIV